MRTLVGCSSSLERGSGISSYTKDLCEALTRQGVSVHLAAPRPLDIEWARTHQIEFFPVEQHCDQLTAARLLLTYIAEREIEAVINNDNSVVQSIAPASRCPFIVIAHMMKTAIASLACYQPQWTDYVVTISDDMRTHFIGRYRVPPTSCVLIHNGVSDRGPGEPRNPAHPVRVIYAGGFDKRIKGADLALNTIRRLAGNIRARIITSWYGDVPQHIRRVFDGEDTVRFFSRVPRDEFVDALRSSDVLLFPSRFEGCPMTVLEAMSFGVVPIVSNGKGAMRWLVQHGQNGFICSLRDWAREAEQCVAFLAGDSEILNEMKGLARQKCINDFGIDAVARSILGLIARPVVKRLRIPSTLTILDQHRPFTQNGKKAPILRRIRYRAGVLRSAGTLRITPQTL